MSTLEVDNDTESSVSGAGRAPSRVRRILILVAAHAVFIGAVLGTWQWMTEAGIIRELIFSKPSRVFSEVGTLLTTQTTWSAVWVTLSELLSGLAIGASAGVAAGVLLVQIPAVRQALDPLVLAFYTLPRLALVPLFIVWFGLGAGSKIVVVVIHGFVIFLLGTYAAIESVNTTFVDNLRIMGASRMSVLRYVYLPWSAPFLFTAFRQALGLGLGSVVVAELIGSFDGIGYQMGLRLARFDMTGTFSWVVLAATLAVVFDLASAQLERRLVRWR